MTVIQTSAGQAGRTRWLKITTAFWLLLISAVAIINSVGLSRLIEQAQASAHDGQVKALTARVADLEQEVDAVSRQPRPISQTDFDLARQALEQRLLHVEQARNDADHTSELQAVLVRLEEAENRLGKANQLVSPAPDVRRHVPIVHQPKAEEPPFRLIGVELRGGERFLSVTSMVSSTLADIRLLRLGDIEGGWQLESIDVHDAVFRVNGQIRRVAVP
ncbi:hypothetical protein [Pseudomonas silesiensis]|uniref:hypothetical protein n=1 Tax=Pseudomonas silesiensis TaxID=1853130 RepID=UPI0034D4EB9F